MRDGQVLAELVRSIDVCSPLMRLKRSAWILISVRSNAVRANVVAMPEGNGGVKLRAAGEVANLVVDVLPWLGVTFLINPVLIYFSA